MFCTKIVVSNKYFSLGISFLIASIIFLVLSVIQYQESQYCEVFEFKHGYAGNGFCHGVKSSAYNETVIGIILGSMATTMLVIYSKKW